MLVLLLLAIGGGGYWLCRPMAARHGWFPRANKMLDGGQPNGKDAFSYLTSLSGSLPFTINAGLEALDDRGVFLKAPQNSFVWKWRELPGCIHIEKAECCRSQPLRLPDLPPAEEPKEPSKPLSFDDIRAYIGKGAREFLAGPPSWMPIVKIDNVALVNATLPQSLLGGGAARGVEGDKQRQEAENRSGPKQDGDAQKNGRGKFPTRRKCCGLMPISTLRWTRPGPQSMPWRAWRTGPAKGLDAGLCL